MYLLKLKLFRIFFPTMPLHHKRLSNNNKQVLLPILEQAMTSSFYRQHNKTQYTLHITQ